MGYVTYVGFLFDLQERSVAQAENRPMPQLYNSYDDIRPFNMNDFSRPHMNMLERLEHEHISFAFWSKF